jgi:hypothetical protein
VEREVGKQADRPELVVDLDALWAEVDEIE